MFFSNIFFISALNPPHNNSEIRKNIADRFYFHADISGPDPCNKTKVTVQFVLECRPVLIYSKQMTCLIVAVQQSSISSPAVVLMLPWSSSIDYVRQDKGYWIARRGPAFRFIRELLCVRTARKSLQQISYSGPTPALSRSSLLTLCGLCQALIKQEAHCCEYDWRL